MIARIDQDDTLPIDQVVHGECLSVMRSFPDNSVDSIVCDPPAGISFMNKDFDHHRGGRDLWIVWLAEIMREALRVIRPGGHALVWSLPRTSHWTATALEDAGFEIRDCITHLFGSGFPKSLNLGNGYGSALKPAAEFWWLCRKPLSEKTLAANVLRWNCGGLNIDKSRVGYANEKDAQPKDYSRSKGIGTLQEECREQGARPYTDGFSYLKNDFVAQTPINGRFPSNVLFSHSLFCTDDVCDEGCPVRVLEQQSGVRKTGAIKPYEHHNTSAIYGEGKGWHTKSGMITSTHEASTGTASRFFHCFTPDVPFLYCAKSSRSERNLGCEELEELERHTQGRDEVKWIDRLDGKGKVPVNARIQPSANIHPTVKSVSLMKYLVSLITPDNGIVLDMFAGSGSTGVAAIAEGYHFIGIEQSDTPDEPYCTIARARITHALRGAS